MSFADSCPAEYGGSVQGLGVLHLWHDYAFSCARNQ